MFKLHHYTQTLPHPAGWFDGQIKMFESSEPVQWRAWLDEFTAGWCASSLAFLNGLAPGNELAAKAWAALENLPENFTRDDFAAALERLSEIPAACPYGKKGLLLAPLEEILADAGFLFPLVRAPDGVDPLAEDWNWARTNLLALLRLAADFGAAFAEAKRELGALDFHDLEQHTLRLLWDGATQQPTAIAREWQAKLRFIFVDEYQDINAAQDKIIEALSGAGAAANRFLVGFQLSWRQGRRPLR